MVVMMSRIRKLLLQILMRLPRPLILWVAGRPREADGERLDLHCHWLNYWIMTGGGPQAVSPSGLVRARTDWIYVAGALAGGFSREVRCEDRRLPGPDGAAVPVRVYRPPSSRPLPVVVYYHGGGWVLGCLDSYHGFCGQLAAAAECIVVSVGYRLAPEHRFPAAVDDAVHAYRWVRDHAEEVGGDPDRLVASGDSVGCSLAVAVTLAAKEAGEPLPYLQFLIYPVLDVTLQTAPLDPRGDGIFITGQRMQWFRDTYLRSELDREDPRVSPLLHDDFGALPPTFVVTAGFDPLQHQGVAYVRKLREAGNRDVEFVRYPSLIHGFLHFRAMVPAARPAFDDVMRRLREKLGPRR